MFVVYVLRSFKNKKRYIGYTSKDSLERLKEHNVITSYSIHYTKLYEILTVTSNPKTFNQLALVWGVRARFFEKGGVFREDIDWLVDQSKQAGDLQIDDKTVLIMGRMENEKIRLIGLKEIE